MLQQQAGGAPNGSRAHGARAAWQGRRAGQGLPGSGLTQQQQRLRPQGATPCMSPLAERRQESEGTPERIDEGLGGGQGQLRQAGGWQRRQRRQRLAGQPNCTGRTAASSARAHRGRAGRRRSGRLRPAIGASAGRAHRESGAGSWDDAGWPLAQARRSSAAEHNGNRRRQRHPPRQRRGREPANRPPNGPLAPAGDICGPSHPPQLAQSLCKRSGERPSCRPSAAGAPDTASTPGSCTALPGIDLRAQRPSRALRDRSCPVPPSPRPLRHAAAPVAP